MKIIFSKDFFSFGGFLTHFATITSKTSTLNNEKKNYQGNSKSADPDFAGCKKGSFRHFNAIILQSMWSTFLKKIPHINLIV
jgi:hypothetical protein